MKIHGYVITLISFLLMAGALSASEILVLGLFKDMAIIKVDDTRHKLRTGETTPDGIKLISSNSEQAILEINGKRQRLTLSSHQAVSTSSGKKKITEAKIWANRGMYQTTGLINGYPVNLMIDTGASTVAMGTTHAERLGINYRYKGRRNVARTASGVVNTWEVKLDSVKIGDIELKNVDGAVVEGAGPSTILLGMSFLKHVKMQREGNLLQLQLTH
ncbi:MAG: retroviral-like aspartic protease family protein [Gammaproteobacteria bacterium]|nr:retroviral-like aspartic protease family protein [Gammaproteobacteria bacterium]